MKKKILALFLTAALAVSVTACGSDDSKSASIPADTTETADAGQTETKQKEEAEKAEKEAEEAKADVENPIEEALKRMAEVDSMELTVVIRMDMLAKDDGESQAIESVTTMNMECMINPLKVKMEMEVNAKTDTGDKESESVSIYGDVDENGNYVMYMFDGENWLAQEVSEFDLDRFNAKSRMEEQIGDTSVYVLEGTKKIAGVDTYKYSYTMTGAEMKEALRDSGALGYLSRIGLSESDAYDMLDELGEIVTNVYVDAETYYPIRYEMDMTEVMNDFYAAVLEARGEQPAVLTPNVSEMVLIMSCYNFNGVSDITIPEEALSAAAQ